MTLLTKGCFFILKQITRWEKRKYSYGSLKKLSLDAMMYNDLLFTMHKNKKVIPITFWIGINENNQLFTGGVAPISLSRESILRIMLRGIEFWNTTKWHNGCDTDNALEKMGVTIKDKELDLK